MKEEGNCGGEVKRKHPVSKRRSKGEKFFLISRPTNRQGMKVAVQNKLLRITLPAL